MNWAFPCTVFIRNPSVQGVWEKLRVQSFKELLCHNSIWMLNYRIQICIACTHIHGHLWVWMCACVSVCVCVCVHLMGLDRDPGRRLQVLSGNKYLNLMKSNRKGKKGKPMNINFLLGPLLSFQYWANSPVTQMLWLSLCENILVDLSLLRI